VELYKKYEIGSDHWIRVTKNSKIDYVCQHLDHKKMIIIIIIMVIIIIIIIKADTTLTF
jgi:hypothetical protein